MVSEMLMQPINLFSCRDHKLNHNCPFMPQIKLQSVSIISTCRSEVAMPVVKLNKFNVDYRQYR